MAAGFAWDAAEGGRKRSLGSRRNIVINWGVSSHFGWGIYGLNLALAWANDPQVALLCAGHVGDRGLTIDPVRRRSLCPFLEASAQLRAQLQPLKGTAATAEAPMLAALGPDLGVALTADEVALSGKPTLGVTFFESAVLPPGAVETGRRYPLIIAGSSWNAQVLRAHGLANVTTILQGVDPSLFHPGPRASADAERFLVFSGGKLERRKGQDLVLAAFRRFAERHPDALLIAAWHSPWPQMARSVDKSGLAEPVVFDAEGRVDSAAWAAANGVRPENFLDAGATPNALMPQLLRQMDVALFPNRCEGGTNLVAMECMACGVPVILSANSGHLDLIEDENCFVLARQAEIADDPHAAAFAGVPGWGESDVDEAVELLERAYADREDARRRGERGAATLSRLSWATTAAKVKAAVLEHCPD